MLLLFVYVPGHAVVAGDVATVVGVVVGLSVQGRPEKKVNMS